MIRISQISIGAKEIEAVKKVLKSGMIAQGPAAAQFEKKFADFCGTKYAVAVNSGTAALHCALYAAGVKKGDEVVTTPFTFIATANSILMQGAKPVFADIDPEDCNIDPSKIEEKITAKTKAILPVDLYGNPYKAKAVGAIAGKYGLKVIEDACQAHGAEFGGKKAGSLGDAGCFSFYATKNMATGEGGMVTTDSEDLAEAVKMFRHHGQSAKTNYQYYDLGFNYRMTDISAAIGLEQLKKIDKLNKKRMENAAILSEGLSRVKGLAVPVPGSRAKHVFHQYTVRVTEEFKCSREELIGFLKEKGVESRVFYPDPLHLFPHISKIGYKKGDFPVAEKTSKEVLSLPANPFVSRKDLKLIIKTIKEI